MSFIHFRLSSAWMKSSWTRTIAVLVVWRGWYAPWNGSASLFCLFLCFITVSWKRNVSFRKRDQTTPIVTNIHESMTMYIIMPWHNVSLMYSCHYLHIPDLCTTKQLWMKCHAWHFNAFKFIRYSPNKRVLKFNDWTMFQKNVHCQW